MNATRTILPVLALLLSCGCANTMEPNKPFTEQSFRRPDITDATLHAYIAFTEAERVNLSHTDITDAGLADLAKWPKIFRLDLSYTHITGEGLAHLAKLPINELSLTGTLVTDAGLACLPKLPRMGTLVLDGTLVTDAGLSCLRETNVGDLYLRDTAVTDAGLAHLPAKLGGLYLARTKITDAGLATLKGRPLGVLDLAGTAVTDAGLAHLAALARLETLDLSGTAVTDAGLGALKALPALRGLYLAGTTVSPAGLADLRKACPNLTIQLEDGRCTIKPFTSLDEAAQWLHVKARQMIRASRTPMPNGVAAFPPQAGAGYEAFWLRDYAYQLEGCIEAFSDKELRESCLVFVNALRADGAGVDCVKFDGTPIYMPGYGSMGANPVADGSQFTVEVAWYTYQKTKDDQFLKGILDKLAKTMAAAPRNPATGLIHIRPEGWDRCPYGFTDSIRKQGDELFCSLLYVQACRQLGDLMEAGHRPEDAKTWRAEAQKLAPVIRKTFWNEKTGLFLATTAQCNQPDIWGSAFAVYLDVASADQARTIAAYFKDHYSQIVQKGQIRHLPGGVFWQVGCDPNTYQNGGFWATATGWFVYTLDLVDPKLADQTVIDLANDFRERGVSEWVLDGRLAVMNYLASATMPLAGVQRMTARRGESLVLKEIVEALPGRPGPSPK
ncbi:MAG: hypothetical protein NTV86_07910 [Planctomycetota bacterium]|nr:hypothetical protein [Planctomycetota bacterium]